MLKRNTPHQVSVTTAQGTVTKTFPTYNKAFSYAQDCIFSGVTDMSQLSGAGVVCEGAKSVWNLPSKRVVLEEIPSP